MNQPVIAVQGAKQLRATLRRAGDDLTDMKAAHALVAGYVATQAASRAPRGPTGRLAASVRPAGTKTMAVIRAGYARVPYAGPIHWGWPARHIGAQPFLTDTASNTEPTWVGMYTDEVDRILTRVEGK